MVTKRPSYIPAPVSVLVLDPPGYQTSSVLRGRNKDMKWSAGKVSRYKFDIKDKINKKFSFISRKKLNDMSKKFVENVSYEKQILK